MTPKEYESHAEECDHLADLAVLDANKRALLASAVMWRKLATAGRPKDGAADDLAKP
jgi:hypothetical protein